MEGKKKKLRPGDMVYLDGIDDCYHRYTVVKADSVFAIIRDKTGGGFRTRLSRLLTEDEMNAKYQEQLKKTENNYRSINYYEITGYKDDMSSSGKTPWDYPH